MRLVSSVVLSLLVGSVAGREAQAACNLIPSASKTFRGPLGATNRPFAAPGDFVEVAVDQSRSATGPSRFAPAGENHVVTIVFTPTAGHAPAAFLTPASSTS